MVNRENMKDWGALVSPAATRMGYAVKRVLCSQDLMTLYLIYRLTMRSLILSPLLEVNHILNVLPLYIYANKQGRQFPVRVSTLSSILQSVTNLQNGRLGSIVSNLNILLQRQHQKFNITQNMESLPGHTKRYGQ